jgi:hypothetical protein
MYGSSGIGSALSPRGAKDMERNPAPARGRIRIFDHLVLIMLATLPMAAFLPAIGSGSMTPAKLSALGLAGAMIGVGVVLWWLPGFAAKGESSRLGALILPGFIVLVSIEVGLTFLAYNFDSTATGLVLFALLVGLIYVSFR